MEAKCLDGSIVFEHTWASNNLADLLAKKGANLGWAAHPRSQPTQGVRWRHPRRPQKFEACVARKKALRKQLGGGGYGAAEVANEHGIRELPVPEAAFHRSLV